MEAWKDIPGYEGKYQASTAGNIRSLDRHITQLGRGGKPFTRLVKGRVLRPGQYCKAGHVSVVLGRKRFGIPVHRLVMLTFVGPCPMGQEVRHLNGHSKDNRLENLAYGTRSENNLDVLRQGKAYRKLTTADAREIKRLLSLGESSRDIAEQFKISIVTVSQIRLGRTHIDA